MGVLVGYVRVTLLEAVFDSVAIGTAAAIAGVPVAFALGALVFISVFIPIIGAVISGLLVVLVALVTKGFTTAVILAIVVLVVQQFDANVLYPSSPPAASRCIPSCHCSSSTTGGLVGGLFGAFIAVPFAGMALAARRAYLGIDEVVLDDEYLPVDEPIRDTTHPPDDGSSNDDPPNADPPNRRCSRRHYVAVMTDAPWQGDACSLVDAFRAGDHSPTAELDATLPPSPPPTSTPSASSTEDHARAAAASADVSKPFGGVPLGIKELDKVAGWPDTEASVPLADRIAGYTLTHIERLVEGGAVPIGLTTASEFGGVNLTRTLLHGATHNPWQLDRTPGGSSGGSAAAVAGGLLTLATGGDGGGSIRIPAGFCGLVGLKTTYGRIPRGPHFEVGALTVTIGGVTRSVRDTARWIDVANGADRHDPHSLPRVEGWEAGLGTHLDELRGLRVAIIDGFGGAVVSPAHRCAGPRRGRGARVGPRPSTRRGRRADPVGRHRLVAREHGIDLQGARRRVAGLRG